METWDCDILKIRAQAGLLEGDTQTLLVLGEKQFCIRSRETSLIENRMKDYNHVCKILYS